MLSVESVLKCYDSMNGRYVEVVVESEISSFVKRSYWREDMQERRFNKRKIELDENIMYCNAQCCTLIDNIIKKQEREALWKAIKELEERKKLALYLVYIRELTLSNAAKEIGVSSSYMSRMMKQIYSELRELMSDI